MSRKTSQLDLKGSRVLFKTIFNMVLSLVLISLLAACAAPTATTQTPTSDAPETATIATTTPVESPKPQGELVAALPNFGSENWLPWLDPVMPNLDDLVYDMLIYYDEVNHKFIPGLAESWDVSPDGLTLTYHLRKGVQFSDGWGEFSSADVKFNFEKHASPKSVGKLAQTRRIASMDTPDPYTLVVHFKNSNPTFFSALSLGDGGICQGIVCQKYVETVGEDIAGQKPIGSGPYRLIGGQSGSYYKLEALDNHWRVVPEFKYITMRMIPEVSSVVAALKNKEIDLASVTPEQLPDLKANGVATEVSPSGGGIIAAGFGGLAIAADKRYDEAYHNKDPWTDARVRKAMFIGIDRDAINKAVYAGAAEPIGVPLITSGIDKYKYTYDPTAARQLIKDAGYPNGFTFKVISYTIIGVPETPRIIEALAGYWQQIGLDPKIVVSDYGSYSTQRQKLKTAGEISLLRIPQAADMLDKASQNLMPDGMGILYEDEISFTIWKEGTAKINYDERAAFVDKLNQYYYDNYGPIPILRTANCFAWNSDKILPFPHASPSAPLYLEYVRHAQPLNTFRLFTPWPGR